MSTNRLWKNFTGRRCEQETLQQRFLAQPDGLHGLGPCAAFAAQFFISLSACHAAALAEAGPSVFSATSVFKIRIRVHLCSSAVKMYGSLNMKTCLRLIPFMVCLALVPAHAADQASTPSPVDKPAGTAASDLPKSTDPLIDPLTGTPYLAVHNGDIVECATFMIEFQLAHPSEHTLLLYGEIHDIPTHVYPAVAFTWKGRVYFHSYEIGDVRVPDLTPEQVSDGYMSRLDKAYVKLMRYFFQKTYESQHRPFPPSDEQAYQLEQADAAPHVLPNERPGDTDDIQVKRIFFRLSKLALPGLKFALNVPFTYTDGKPFSCDVVTFDFGGFTWEWTSHGCGYLGLAAKDYRMSMLDSIIFSIDYQKANPSEKVYCFLHEASGNHHTPGYTVSTTVFTRNGQLWFHHFAPGDLLSSLSLDDLKDSDKVIDADLAAYNQAIKKFQKEDAQLRHQPPSGLKKYLNGYKAPDNTATGVLADLQKRGVDAELFTCSDTPEVIFTWGNQPYTFIQGWGCFKGKIKQAPASN
jgi:hypothetical protein